MFSLKKIKQKNGENGLLAIFQKQEALLAAVEKVRDLKMKKFDAFTPFPVHGMEKAMGLKRSWIPYATLVFGLTGASLAFLFQSWTSAVSWPLNVGGKPFISWPAFIPVTFECMVLFGGVLTFLTLLATLRLPRPMVSILDTRLTCDHFGLFVEHSDPRFDVVALKKIFSECGALEVNEVGSG